jgi:DNA-binding NarL/FixJ family response regulator
VRAVSPVLLLDQEERRHENEQVRPHLRNIFRKIAVSSRVELARAVEHAGRARSSHAS